MSFTSEWQSVLSRKMLQPAQSLPVPLESTNLHKVETNFRVNIFLCKLEGSVFTWNIRVHTFKIIIECYSMSYLRLFY